MALPLSPLLQHAQLPLLAPRLLQCQPQAAAAGTAAAAAQLPLLLAKVLLCPSKSTRHKLRKGEANRAVHVGTLCRDGVATA